MPPGAGNPRSRAITAGMERAPNRAILRAVGFTFADFGKPIVGVANAHSNLTPCNVGVGRLAAHAEAALSFALRWLADHREGSAGEAPAAERQ